MTLLRVFVFFSLGDQSRRGLAVQILRARSVRVEGGSLPLGANERTPKSRCVRALRAAHPPPRIRNGGGNGGTLHTCRVGWGAGGLRRAIAPWVGWFSTRHERVRRRRSGTADDRSPRHAGGIRRFRPSDLLAARAWGRLRPRASTTRKRAVRPWSSTRGKSHPGGWQRRVKRTVRLWAPVEERVRRKKCVRLLADDRAPCPS